MQVQDSQADQVLGVGHKVGCMIEVCDIKIPSQVVSASTIATFSHDLLHSHLGLVSLSCLQLLASKV